MEVATGIAVSPDFHFANTTFSPLSPRLFGVPLNHQYLYTSAPATPALASPIRAYPSPKSTHRSDDSDDVFDFTFSPIRYHQQRVPRNSFATKSSKVRRRSRSLSPLRNVGNLLKSTSPSASPVKSGLSKKWPKLRNLLLFRSASEGQVTGSGRKDPLKKYTILSSVSTASGDVSGEDKKAGRSGGGGEMVRRVRRGPAISAHEKIYRANRAAAEEQKRKTPLPFQRHGLLGLVDFTPVGRGKKKVAGISSVPTGRF